MKQNEKQVIVTTNCMSSDFGSLTASDKPQTFRADFADHLVQIGNARYYTPDTAADDAAKKAAAEAEAKAKAEAEAKADPATTETNPDDAGTEGKPEPGATESKPGDASQEQKPDNAGTETKDAGNTKAGKKGAAK